MRKLTEEQVAQEASQIRAVLDWPLFPVLPMKHLYRRRDGSDSDLGILFTDDLTTVYVMNLLDFKKGKTYLECREGRPTEKFDSVEDMVRAGWVGD